MPLIDQRILIEAPSEAIWGYLVEPPLVSKWNKNYKQISVLSTRATGQGARRRCVDAAGRTSVEETTAWLENIGFETKTIEGPYKEYRVRIRLQAVPDGTLVNWTVEYRLRGLFAPLQNLFGHRAKIEDHMAVSLKQLRKLILDTGVRLDLEKQARFAMQSAPGVESRLARAIVQVGEDDLPPIIEEAKADSIPAAPQVVAPEVPATIADTKPRPPTGLREALAKESPAPLETTQPSRPVEYTIPIEARERAALTVPVAMVAPPREPDPDTQTMEVTPTSSPVTPIEITVDEGQHDADEPDVPRKPDLPPPTGKRDTGETSIWQIFNVEPPSVQAKAVIDEVIASTQPRFIDSSPKQARALKTHKTKANVRTPLSRNRREKAKVWVRRARK